MRIPAVVILTLVVTACPTEPGPVGPTSSSSTSGGTSTSSSSSSGGGNGEERIELGALCRELRDGYRRALLRTVNRCGAAYSDEDLERLRATGWDAHVASTISQAQVELASASCDQFGSLRVYIDHVTQSIDRGRVAYDPVAAFKCREASSRPNLAQRDRPPVQTGSFALAGVALPDVCNEVFQGLVQEGEACALTHECAPGLFCRPRADDTAEGTCVPIVPIGGTCDGRDECANRGFCAQGQCRNPLGHGESCVDEQGYPLQCGPDLVCLNGICETFGDVGGLCGFSDPPCRIGLVCAAESNGVRRCQEPIPLGGACGNDSECADCLRCGIGDTCQSVLGFGEPCSKDADSCGPGLRCSVANLCEVVPREDEPCRAVFTPSGSTQGDCMYRDNFCARARNDDEEGTCRPFARTLGEPCGLASDVYPTCAEGYCSNDERGTCVRAARLGEPCGNGEPPCDHGFCKLTDTDAGVGECESLPNIGEACGDAPNVASYCQTGFCRRLLDAATGTCTALPDIGDACGTDSNLSPWCVYGTCLIPPGATQGECGYALPPGSPCSTDEECDTFYCDPHVQKCVTLGASCAGCTRFEPVLFLLSLGFVYRRARRH